MFHKIILLISCIASGLLLSSPSNADDLDILIGQWTSDIDGNPIIIKKAFGGYDAYLSWAGQATIAQSSYKGSHFKLASGDIVCYYYITIQNLDKGFAKMTWALKDGSPNCPPKGTYSRSIM